MLETTTAAAPVVRTTMEFGFDNALAVTFSGRPSPKGPRMTYSVNLPKRGFNRKDGSVSITNRSGNWGWSPNTEGPGYVRVWGFVPQTITLRDGTLALWHHDA